MFQGAGTCGVSARDDADEGGARFRRVGVGDSNPIGRNSRRSLTGDGGALRGVQTGWSGSLPESLLRSASSALVRISVERLCGDQTPVGGRGYRKIQLILDVNRVVVSERSVLTGEGHDGHKKCVIWLIQKIKRHTV